MVPGSVRNFLLPRMERDRSAERARKLTTCRAAICGFPARQACGNLQVTYDMYRMIFGAGQLLEKAREQLQGVYAVVDLWKAYDSILRQTLYCISTAYL